MSEQQGRDGSRPGEGAGGRLGSRGRLGSGSQGTQRACLTLGQIGDREAQAPAGISGRKQSSGASCEKQLWGVWPGLWRPARRPKRQDGDVGNRGAQRLESDTYNGKMRPHPLSFFFFSFVCGFVCNYCCLVGVFVLRQVPSMRCLSWYLIDQVGLKVTEICMSLLLKRWDQGMSHRLTFKRQRLSLGWNLLVKVRRLANGLQGFLCFCLSRAGATSPHHHTLSFLCGCWGFELWSSCCAASPLHPSLSICVQILSVEVSGQYQEMGGDPRLSLLQPWRKGWLCTCIYELISHCYISVLSHVWEKQLKGGLTLTTVPAVHHVGQGVAAGVAGAESTVRKQREVITQHPGSAPGLLPPRLRNLTCDGATTVRVGLSTLLTKCRDFRSVSRKPVSLLILDTVGLTILTITVTVSPFSTTSYSKGLFKFCFF